MRTRPLHALTLAPLLAACQSVAWAPAEPRSYSAQSTLASRGQVFAEETCSGCHAVGRDGSSSNPNAPPFRAIINQVDLTTNTVSSWLTNAHNYPSEMSFSLDESQVNALVAYMLSLRDPNYRSPPD